MTRITDLDREPYGITALERSHWAEGDYVVAEVIGAPTPLYRIELASGRMVAALPGDRVIGAFGRRAATLEGVGCWSAMTDGRMHALTGAGLFGKATSCSLLLPRLMSLEYCGHVVRGGRKLVMSEFAIKSTENKLSAPVVLLVGTSMSAGKTTTGRIIVHELAALGLSVIGAKLTGAGRYRDMLSFSDAGAGAIYDFVDAGLPSTVVATDVFRKAIRPLLGHIASQHPDIVVIESGASPLEPYNGASAIDEIGDQIRCTVLCASDPYAVVGVQKAFGLEPDLVTGPATATTAAIDLVRELAGTEALNILDPASLPGLREILARTLGIRFPG